MVRKKVRKMPSSQQHRSQGAESPPLTAFRKPNICWSGKSLPPWRDFRWVCIQLLNKLLNEVQVHVRLRHHQQFCQ